MKISITHPPRQHPVEPELPYFGNTPNGHLVMCLESGYVDLSLKGVLTPAYCAYGMMHEDGTGRNYYRKEIIPLDKGTVIQFLQP